MNGRRLKVGVQTDTNGKNCWDDGGVGVDLVLTVFVMVGLDSPCCKFVFRPFLQKEIDIMTDKRFLTVIFERKSRFQTLHIVLIHNG